MRVNLNINGKQCNVELANKTLSKRLTERKNTNNLFVGVLSAKQTKRFVFEDVVVIRPDGENIKKSVLVGTIV